MNYPVIIEGFEGHQIEFKPQGFFSSYKLIINGKVAEKGPKRGQIILIKNDGSMITATWKPKAAGLDFPDLEVDGKIIRIVRPLAWYEYAWNAVPVLLIIRGGALGAFIGVIAYFANLKTFRSSVSVFQKYGLTALVTLLASGIYFTLVFLLIILVG